MGYTCQDACAPAEAPGPSGALGQKQATAAHKTGLELCGCARAVYNFARPLSDHLYRHGTNVPASEFVPLSQTCPADVSTNAPVLGFRVKQ